MRKNMTEVARHLARRVLRGIVYIHCIVCGFILFVNCGMESNVIGHRNYSGLSLVDLVVVWVTYNPCPFHWTILAFNVLAIYILHASHNGKRRRAAICYVIMLPGLVLVHLGVVAMASFRGTIQSPVKTYVMEGYELLLAVTGYNLLLAAPLITIIIGEYIVSRAIRCRHNASVTCAACGYSMGGLRNAEVCPECGVVLLEQQASRDKPV